MATKSKRHTHKYHKINTGNSSKVWACALPDCMHFMPPHYENLVLGKLTICWKCGEKFIMDTDNMKDDKPICAECNPMLNAMRDAIIERNTPQTEITEDTEICEKCNLRPKMGTMKWCQPCILGA